MVADDRVTDLGTGELDSAGLVDAAEPVYTVDAEDTIAPGRDADEQCRPTRPASPGGADGSSAVRARTSSSATCPVDIECGADGWGLRAANGSRRTPYEAVVLLPPAPTAAELLDRQGIPKAVVAAAKSLADVPYRSTDSAGLHTPITFSQPCYTLVTRAASPRSRGAPGRRASPATSPQVRVSYASRRAATVPSHARASHLSRCNDGWPAKPARRPSTSSWHPD